jgi:hypothetical protein
MATDWFDAEQVTREKTVSIRLDEVMQADRLTMAQLLAAKVAALDESMRGERFERMLFGSRYARMLWRSRSRLVRVLRRGLRRSLPKKKKKSS